MSGWGICLDGGCDFCLVLYIYVNTDSVYFCSFISCQFQVWFLCMCGGGYALMVVVIFVWSCIYMLTLTVSIFVVLFLVNFRCVLLFFWGVLHPIPVLQLVTKAWWLFYWFFLQDIGCGAQGPSLWRTNSFPPPPSPTPSPQYSLLSSKWWQHCRNQHVWSTSRIVWLA